MEEKNLEKIKGTIATLLTKMGFSAEINMSSENHDGQENIICNIEVKEDSNLLIGQHGTNLQSLQHIARLVIRKEIEDRINFVIDVNSYRQQKNQSVIEQARLAADQALNEGRAIILRPMSAYERRIVHLELSKNSSVVTESLGEGEDRKVVVKPANLL